MVISHKHRYVFVEIPHTGSHAISKELCEFYDGQIIHRKHANVTLNRAEFTGGSNS